jgi:hypothetical protein
MFTLTKGMFTLINGMGHERHMVLPIDFFDYSDNFDQMLSCTFNQEGYF